MKPARVILSSLYMNRDTDEFTSCQFSRMARSPEIPSTWARDAAMAPPEVKTAMVFPLPCLSIMSRSDSATRAFRASQLSNSGRVKFPGDPPQHGCLEDPLEGVLADIHLRQLIIQRWVILDHVREQGRHNSDGVILVETAQHLKLRHLSAGGTVNGRAPLRRCPSGAPWSPSRPHRAGTPYREGAAQECGLAVCPKERAGHSPPCRRMPGRGGSCRSCSC